MIKPTWESYLGPHTADLFLGQVAELQGFCVLETEGEAAPEQGKKVIHEIKRILSHEVTSLAHLEDQVAACIQTANLNLSYSLSVGAVKHTTLYVITSGQGHVYIKRQGKFAQLLSGDRSASGYIQEGDTVIFTSNRFTTFVGGFDELKYLVAHKKLREITAELSANATADDNSGACVFVSFNPHGLELRHDIRIDQKATPQLPLQTASTRFALWRSRLRDLVGKVIYNSQHQSRAGWLFKMGAVSLIFVILLWSVILRHTRQKVAQSNKQIQTTRELVNQKLAQADDVAFLNLPRALSLIVEARTEVQKLKTQLGNQSNPEVDKLDAMIKDKESKVTKKEERSYTEFFDLGIDQKDARGVKLALHEDALSILDTQNGIVYDLSLAKKSLDKLKAPEIRTATLVGKFKDTDIIILPNQGIFTLNGDKAKKVIDADKDWGTLTSVAVYNANIYVLDSTKNNIYKYLAVEGGYSAKNEYIKDGDANLNNATSLAIDSSVYVSVSASVLKYTAGARDQFKTSFPDPQVSLTKVYTDKNLDNVYGWDKAKGSLYVMSKDGAYERAIKSTVLAQADDVVVYEKNAYVLVKNKIYKIGVE